jgi:hypothetical protein
VMSIHTIVQSELVFTACELIDIFLFFVAL